MGHRAKLGNKGGVRFNERWGIIPDDLVTQPQALLSHVAHTLEQARRAHRFATALEDAGQEARRKLLPSRR
jgi:hypothetical protein